MVGLDNPIHLVFLLVILLLVFGAKRLPEMGRSLGSGLRGFKESLSGESPIPSDNEPVAAHKVEPAETVELPGALHDSTRAQVSDELETRTAA